MLSASSGGGGVLDTVANPTRTQDWSLDPLGNWASLTTNGTAQNRTTNQDNEVTAVGSSNLAFDKDGNTTTDDQGHTLVYDAWNRLISVQNGSTTLAVYAYDGHAWRITVTASGTTTDLYYSRAWQVLEERVGTVFTDPARVGRFGGLCLGESTHLVDEVTPLEKYLQSRRYRERQPQPVGQAFLLADRGRLTLPVWVDHVGSAGTRYVTGQLYADWPLDRAPTRESMPLIEPPERS